MRMWMHVTGMLALGVAGLLATGIAFNSRAAAPRLPSGPAPVGTAGRLLQPPGSPSARADIASAVYLAVADNLDAAAEAWQRGTGLPAPALDGAWHVARVLDEAGTAATSRSLVARIESARRHLQNGAPAAAAADARLAAMTARAPNPLRTTRRPATTATYDTATLLDAAGARVGIVTAVTPETVTYEDGGLTQVLGFLRLRPGVPRQVPRAAVLFGQPHQIGQTLAVLVAAPPAS